MSIFKRRPNNNKAHKDLAHKAMQAIPILRLLVAIITGASFYFIGYEMMRASFPETMIWLWAITGAIFSVFSYFFTDAVWYPAGEVVATDMVDGFKGKAGNRRLFVFDRTLVYIVFAAGFGLDVFAAVFYGKRMEFRHEMPEAPNYVEIVSGATGSQRAAVEAIQSQISALEKRRANALNEARSNKPAWASAERAGHAWALPSLQKEAAKIRRDCDKKIGQLQSQLTASAEKITTSSSAVLSLTQKEYESVKRRKQGMAALISSATVYLCIGLKALTFILCAMVYANFKIVSGGGVDLDGDGRVDFKDAKAFYSSDDNASSGAFGGNGIFDDVSTNGNGVGRDF